MKTNEDICPYKGLFSFKEDDEHVFFGRKKLISEIVEQLRKNPRFLAVVGSSGSGKSSLMFAGVLPRILRGEIVGFENAQVVTFRPNDVSKSDNVCDSYPDESLRKALKESGINLEKDDLWEGLLTHLEKESETRLVLYADQFETLFANVDEDKQKEFIQNIYRLLRSNLKVRFLLTVRGDYYDFLLKSMLGEYLSGGQVNVRSMSIEEMREAIKKPADETGFKIEKGLEDKIITNLDNTKNPLPLLEFTLTQLWKLRSDGMLTLKSYDQIGGAAGSIGQWANETYNSLNAEEKELARKIFTRLIQYGERDLPDSRRRLPLNELAGSKDKQFVRQLIRKLADAHLLVTDCELSKKAQTVEIIHDSLLIEWEQLKKWIDEHRGFLTWRQRLEDKMGEWNNNNKDEGYLLRGAPFVEAKDRLEEYKEELNRGEIKYIEASSELEEKERAEKERTRSHIIKGLTTFSFVILLIAVFALSQWNEANNQKQIAEEQKQLAENKTKENRNLYLSSQSISNSTFLQRDPKNMDKSVLLAIESYQIRQTVDADRLIRQGLLSIPHNVMVLNHSGEVNAVEFSPDGKYIATASDDKTACVWDASTGRQIASINHN